MAVFLAMTAVLLGSTRSLTAQQPQNVRHDVFAGSELEEYLRILQLSGDVPLYPWSVRGFSAHEVERLAPQGDHPWADRFDFAAPDEAGPHFSILRPGTRLIFNSSFPYGGNDGAIWAGKGLTAAVQAGFAAEWGPLSLRVAPIVFWAQNSGFELEPTGFDDDLRFANRFYPNRIDLPQRFGDGGYAQVDAGQTTLRLDVGPLAAGISNANQVWGPGSEHPLILSANAAGFWHGFVGTARPANLWLFDLQARVMWGRLEQSEFAVATGRIANRHTAGLVLAIEPRGLTGLELGVSRFFHIPEPEDGFQDILLRPFEGVFRRDLESSLSDPFRDYENEMASAFFRWAVPGAGAEVYGEFMNEDHSFDERHLILQPDDASTWMLGARKVWTIGAERRLSLKGEVMSAEANHIARLTPLRGQPSPYRHTYMTQGHTHRGQLLASPLAIGGPNGSAAATLKADLIEPDGSWSAGVRRIMRSAPGDQFSTTSDTPRDVLYALMFERMMFYGDWQFTGGIEAAYNFNRNNQDDATNLNVWFGVQVDPRRWWGW